MSRFLGIDPSTKTGVVLIDTDKAFTSWQVLQFPSLKGIVRVQAFSDAFSKCLDERKPTIVAMEGYAYGGPSQYTLAILVEIGTVFRMELHKRDIPWFIVPPSVLKKYCTGSGHAKKKAIAEAVKERWGFTDPSNDVVDAYVLARIAEDLATGVTDLKEVERG